MITPNDKAKELINKYLPVSREDIYDEVFQAFNKKYGPIKRTFKSVLDFSRMYHAKKAAKISAEEIVSVLHANGTGFDRVDDLVFWHAVVVEIEFL